MSVSRQKHRFLLVSIIQIPNAVKIVTATGGTSSADSRFSVLICLMPRIPRPLLKIRIPPTRLISVISVSVING